MQIGRFDLGPGPLPRPMVSSDATGLALAKVGGFGADLIRFPAGGEVRPHTHPGDHILVVVSGSGWVDYDGVPHALEAGVLYLVPGSVPHGIRAETELTLLSIANDHRPVDAESRLEMVDAPRV